MYIVFKRSDVPKPLIIASQSDPVACGRCYACNTNNLCVSPSQSVSVLIKQEDDTFWLQEEANGTLSMLVGMFGKSKKGLTQLLERNAIPYRIVKS